MDEVDRVDLSRQTDSLRLRDLCTTVEVLVEATALERGARERVADRCEIQKSVITDRVARMERFFGVALFMGPQRKTPTAAGKLMGRYGPKLLEEIDHFAGMLRDASEREELP